MFDFSAYLDHVCANPRYCTTRSLYTATDALLPLEAQTAIRQERENEQSEIPRQQGERFPVLTELRKYAQGERREHILLSGRPGSGKSTTLKQILLDMASAASSDDTQPIPVLVQLKSDRPILKLIANELEKGDRKVKAKEIKRLLRQNRLVLLIDGINEIPSEGLRKQLQEFRDSNLITLMIFTTRDLAVGGDLGIEKRLKMCPLTEPQMQEFVQKYLPEHWETLLRQLKDRLQEVAETPLLLKMLCDVFDPKTQQIPQSKGELFQRFDRDYQHIKQDIQVVPVSENFWEFKSEVLQHLAFTMIQADAQEPSEAWLTLPKNQAECILEKWLTERGLVDAPTKAKLWLKDLLNHHLLQVAADPKKIEFHHQLFQEYYAAESLLVMLRDNHLDVMDDQRFQYFYLNCLKWTEAIAIALSLLENEAIAVDVVRSALKVDWILGARLAGEVRLGFQRETIGLVNALKLPDWVKAELLGRTRSKLVLPNLIEFLRHQDISIARIAAVHIGEADNSLAIQILTERLKSIDTKFFSQRVFGGPDRTGDIWTEHIQALAYVAPQKAVQFLHTKLLPGGGSASVIMMFTGAAELLMQLDSAQILPRLISDLKQSKSQDQKNEILNLISASKDYELILVDLVHILKHEEDENTQTMIGRLITKSDSELAIQTSIWMMHQYNTNLRKEAIHHLIKNRVDQIRDLEHLLFQESDNSDLSFSAAIVLGSLGYEVALPFLGEKLITHQFSGIRSYAAKALGGINTHRSIAYLLEGLNDPAVSVRRAVAFSLASLEKPEAIPVLMECLIKSPRDIRTCAVRSLAKLGVEEPLWNILRNKIAVWQTATVELVKLGKSKAIPYLCDTLVEPESESPNEVIDLLAQFADDQVVNWLLDALEHPSQHMTDQYFSNRVAFVLNRCKLDLIVSKLSDFMTLSATKHIKQLSWLTPTIQNQYKYYNYEINQWELVPNMTQRSPTDILANIDKSTQNTNQKINQMADSPQRIINAEKYFEKVEDGYHEHNYASNKKETQAEQQLTQLLNNLRQESPNVTDTDIFPTLVNRFEVMPRQNPQEWQRWQDVFSVIFAGGVEVTKILVPVAGIPIEVLKRLYEIYQRHPKHK